MREFAHYQPSARKQADFTILDLPRLYKKVPEQVQRTDEVIDAIDQTLALEQQFNEVQSLQNRWDGALGNTTKQETILASNYNPVLARWNYERMETGEQKDIFRKSEIKNIETALRERNQTVESKLTFTFDEEGKIRNEMFPDEPYEAMLERGRVYREKHGSTELIREQAEIDGFNKIQQKFANPETPPGTKMLMISPPSEQKDSIYTHNFVDTYELGVDEKTGERVINYTRFASALDSDHYASIATGVDNTYFIKKELQEEDLGEKIPTDAWYLGNPLEIPEGLDLKKDIKAMEEKEWEKLWKLYMPFAMHLLDTLTKDDFDPIAIAEAYNTLLHSGENKAFMKQMEDVAFDDKAVFQEQIHSMVSRYGRQEVAERKVGCGSSGGVTIGSPADALQNSVGQFADKVGEDKYGSREFDCPDCHKKNRRPENTLVSACQHCGSKGVGC